MVVVDTGITVTTPRTASSTITESTVTVIMRILVTTPSWDANN